MRTACPAALRPGLVLVCLLTAAVAAASDWTGTWDSNWTGGGVRMVLMQDGAQVTGTYEPGHGTLSGTADGQALRGRWGHGPESGTFEIDISGDGTTFFGHLGNGDWWSGSRVGSAHGQGSFAADLASPRAALRTFLTAANAIQAGRREYVNTALACLETGRADDPNPGSHASDRPILFFDVLNACTIRLADIPDSCAVDTLALRLGQAGTGQSVTVTAVRTAGGWKLRVPSEDTLRADLRRLLAARGRTMVNSLEYLDLGSPRATLRTFIEEYKKWDHGGREHVAAALDLSGISPPLRDAMLPLLATYLKQTLDRIGYVIWQEVPDDPRRTIPYVHFQHPRGAVVIAPARQDSVVTWKFTAQTLADVRTLYETLEDVPLAGELIPDRQQAVYFRLNRMVRNHVPQLTRLTGGLELWQWLAIVASALLTFGIVAVLGGLTRVLVDRGLSGAEPEVRRRLRAHLLLPLVITLATAVGYTCITNLGLPLSLFPVLHGVAVLVIGLGLTWTVFTLTNLLQESLARRAAATPGYYDELLVAMLGSLFKVLVVVAGVVFLADEIGLPLSGVLAGLGVGGFALAFAAKDTLANLFGSAVILADRPFARGDLVSVAGHEGYVDRVGLRSTQIRTREDSLVAIPNSLLANEVIDNLGRRRHRRIRSRVGVLYSTPPDRLEAFATGLMETMRQQRLVQPMYMSAGVWEFNDSSIDLEFSCYVDAGSQADERAVRHALFLDIVRLADRLGVEFAFPTRTVHLAEAEKERPDRLDGPAAT
ncbi:MAG TPA: mechanosensitive ion channel [Candidatus Krumholzibacteria bacterium]|nr:mechanosensitive ion channel [Candidatus Krumholzibacteria bacterium]